MKELTLTLVLALLASCAVQVKTRQNPQTDFSKFESWCWMQGCEVTYQGPEYYYDQKVIDEISNAIAWNMHEKGYLQSDDQSDLVLNFHITLNQDSAETRDLYIGTFRDEAEWLKALYPEYQQFLKGSLVIDVVNRRSSELIWTSKAVKYLAINPSYDKKSIWSAVGRAMKKFPARSKN